VECRDEDVHEQWENQIVIMKNGLLKKKTVALVRKQTIPTSDRPLLAKLEPTLVDRGCLVVSTTDPNGH
jgi:hypothetical protein